MAGRRVKYRGIKRGRSALESNRLGKRHEPGRRGYTGGFVVSMRRVAPQMPEAAAPSGNYAIEVIPESAHGYTMRKNQASMTPASHVIPEAINKREAGVLEAGEIAFANLGTRMYPRKIGDVGRNGQSKPIASSNVNGLSDESIVRPIGVVKTRTSANQRDRDGRAVTIRGVAKILNTGADVILPLDYVGWSPQPTVVETAKGLVPAVIMDGEESNKMRGSVFPVRYTNVAEQMNAAHQSAKNFIKQYPDTDWTQDKALPIVQAFVDQHTPAIGPSSHASRMLAALALIWANGRTVFACLKWIQSYIQNMLSSGAVIRPISKTHTIIPGLSTFKLNINANQEPSNEQVGEIFSQLSRISAYVSNALGDELRSCIVGQALGGGQPAKYLTLDVNKTP